MAEILHTLHRPDEARAILDQTLADLPPDHPERPALEALREPPPEEPEPPRRLRKTSKSTRKAQAAARRRNRPKKKRH